jgi:hypothetical protein
MNTDRIEHHPGRRVDRNAHLAREAAFTEVPLDEMTESGLVHSNIYGERNEGYPGQGEYGYDEFEDPREAQVHPDERGDYEAAQRGLM